MAFLQIISTTVVLSLLFAVGEVVRRLYFHPLAHIPGPKLAAATWWYEFYWDIIQPGKYVFRIQELHQKYGPIIRITPDELHVNDVGFEDTVYASATVRRDKYNYQLRSLRVPGGVGTTAHYNVHKKRREALGSFFSRRNVLYLEPLIATKIEELCQLMTKHAVAETPVNLSDAFFAISNDIVINFLFAHQADVLADESKAATLRQNSDELLKGVHLNRQLPWVADFLESLPLAISKPMMPPGLVDMVELVSRVRTELVQIMKAKASGIESEKPVGPTGKQSVYDSVLDSRVLPPEEKSLTRLEQEGTLLVLAGTGSPTKSLEIIFYHLLANPPILAKLRAELNGLTTPASWSQLEPLPYLSAIVEEGNRLSFGVTARAARISDDPLRYTPSQYVTTPASVNKSYVIPAGTPVSITTLSSHTAETVFPDPYAFKPERWLGDQGRELRKFQMAWGRGGRICLGMEFAKAELYLVIAALVKRFDMSLWQTDISEVEFEHDYHVATPRLDAKGVRVVVKERRVVKH